MRQKKPVKNHTVHSNQPINSNPSLGPNLIGGVLQGFSFGSGSAIAHNLFGSKPQVTEENQKCKFFLENYNKICKTNNLLENENIQKNCSKLYEELKDVC